MCNLDSKIHFLGVVCFKIQFHISCAVTFSTASAKRRHAPKGTDRASYYATTVKTAWVRSARALTPITNKVAPYVLALLRDTVGVNDAACH